MLSKKYEYRNCPIPGGGYVTGFSYHPNQEGIFYLRTDIGGTYRFDGENQRWESLINHVTMKDLRETFPIAIALDEKKPELLYIASGIWNQPPGKLSVSKDYGQTFTYYDMPFRVHGNLNGRGTGYRMIVDSLKEDTIWFASQADGLWKSENGGSNWEKLEDMPEDYLTFVGQIPGEEIYFVGSAGVTTKRSQCLRGKGLYLSVEQGRKFEILPGPEDGEVEGVKLAGLVPQRYAFSKDYLYVTFSVMGRNAYVLEHGYSCDGGSVIGGKLVRYELDSLKKASQEKDMSLVVWKDVTPDLSKLPEASNPEGESPMDSGNAADKKSDVVDFGLSGLATTLEQDGMVVVSTISKEDGDCIFRSMNHGETWEVILYDLAVGKMDFRTSYLKPEHNGGHNLIHWLTDLKINPFDVNELWFNTGTGVFRTRNLLDSEVHFTDWSDGVEETVHLNLYSPVKGEVKLIDILGDLGGFAFRKLDQPCRNSFDDEHGNRYITCINADTSDLDEKVAVITPRGNWTGKTKGGLIITKDEFQTFKRLPMPFGISEKLDQALHFIEHPNVNSGWVAMSPDTRRIVWAVADMIELPIDQLLVSDDQGASFKQAEVYAISGERKSTGLMKPFSDRLDSKVFYGFGEAGQFYVSTDGGFHFYQKEITYVSDDEETAVLKDKTRASIHEKVQFGLIDCANKTEVRGEAGRSGVFYMALKEYGLKKLSYDKDSDTAILKNLGKEGDIYYRLGLGLGRENGDYCKDHKAIYVAATIDGSYGFYQSLNDGASFVRLNEANQMYGEVNSMEGDSQVFGRFYIATGSRGVLYGEPAKEKTYAF